MPVMNEDQKKEFEEVCEPVIKFLCDFHPHVKIIIENDTAEFLEGQRLIIIKKHIKD